MYAAVQVAAAIPEGAEWQLERNLLNGHFKAVTVYVWL